MTKASVPIKAKKMQSIDKHAIVEYLFPELENIKALLEGLHLVRSLQALIFLQKIMKDELEKFRF